MSMLFITERTRVTTPGFTGSYGMHLAWHHSMLRVLKMYMPAFSGTTPIVGKCLPCVFHAEVKVRCVVTVSLLLSAHDPIAIVELDADFNYIFPRCSKTNNDALVGSPDLRHPYCSSVIISEVPKAMLVLVSTAYYAALHEWSTGKWKQHDFTTNTFVEAYDCHIVSLNWIESECKTSYHKMMAEIYQLAANGGSRTDPSPPSNSVLNLSMLED
ncbi:hypothetical protein H4582DRAFT_2063413 [Lactarius indigo]|nr:hypothetical protein H4582DRAFT_2063413 [Lactarius indigo]